MQLSSQVQGGIMVCEFSWLTSLPFSFPKCLKARSQQLSSDTVAYRECWAPRCLPSASACSPRVAAPLLLIPATTTTTQVREIWPISLYLVLAHSELVPSPFGNHVLDPFSVQVSYLKFIACQR